MGLPLIGVGNRDSPNNGLRTSSFAVESCFPGDGRHFLTFAWLRAWEPLEPAYGFGAEPQRDTAGELVL